MNQSQKQRVGLKASICLAMFMTFSFTANAQSSSPQDLLQCDKIKKPEDRLSCFNTIVEKLKEDPNAFKRATHGGQKGRDGNRSNSSNNSPEFGKTFKPRNTPKKITARVKRYWQNLRGKWHFYLENGQVWKETSGSHLRLTKKVEEVRIKKGLMGGYIIVIKGAPTTGRVKRID